MKIQKEFTADNQVKVTAEFEPELLEQFKHKAARKIAQRTRIPGFRPGKAPYSMVVTHVGEATIHEEAVELMLDKVYPEVLAEAEIKPYGPGNLDAIKSENPPVFEFTIPLEPTVELGNVESLREEYQPPQINDEDVQEFITRSRRNSSSIVPTESPATEGNVVFLTIEEVELNPIEGADPILLKETPQQILIPTEAEEKETEYPFKGFSRSLIGHTAGNRYEIEHEFPEDYSDPDLAGKKVLFKIYVQSVKALELPEMNEEFLSTMGNFKTVDELENAVRQNLQADSDASYDNNYYTGLIDKLRQDATIKYPPQMLADEEEQVQHRFEYELSDRQMDLDVYLKVRKIDKETFIAEEVRPTALNRLERSLVMEALTKKYDIKIGNEELEQEVSNIISELLMSGELKDIQKDLGEKKFANVISMEAANRALEKSIRQQLLKIASPESVIEPEAPSQVDTETQTESATQAEEEITDMAVEPEEQKAE